MGRWYWDFGLFVLAVASFPPAVRADDREACKNSNPEVSIIGCSAIIDAGTETEEIIAAAYNNRGIAYKNKGEYDSAIKDYNKAIALNPKYAAAYSNRGLAYNNKGEHDRALEDFDKALTLNPVDASAYNNRGIARKDMGEYDSAIKDYDKAITLNPKFGGPHYNRGLVYEILGYKQKAETDYQKALSLLPGNQTVITALQRLNAATAE